MVLRSLARPEVDHGFLELMRRSGAGMVMIGFEAITDEGLASVGKRLSVATQTKAVRALHQHGIAVHGMFVAGLDTDDASVPGATADFARLGIETFQLMAETPLPGTHLWERGNGGRAAAVRGLVALRWSPGRHAPGPDEPAGPAARGPRRDAALLLVAEDRPLWARRGPLALPGPLGSLPACAGAPAPNACQTGMGEALGRGIALLEVGATCSGPRKGGGCSVAAGFPPLRQAADRSLARRRSAPGRTSSSSRPCPDIA